VWEVGSEYPVMDVEERDVGRSLHDARLHGLVADSDPGVLGATGPAETGRHQQICQRAFARIQDSARIEGVDER
jgi:hypothetical protein